MTNIIKKVSQCVFTQGDKRCQNGTYGGGRGLCTKHLIGWAYHIKKGNTTWEQLEAEGKCLRKMTQAEKNMNQMHPHRSYKQRNIV